MAINVNLKQVQKYYHGNTKVYQDQEGTALSIRKEPFKQRECLTTGFIQKENGKYYLSLTSVMANLGYLNQSNETPTLGTIDYDGQINSNQISGVYSDEIDSGWASNIITVQVINNQVCAINPFTDRGIISVDKQPINLTFS